MKNKQPRTLAMIAFALYGVLMLWLLFGQRIGDTHAGTYAEQLAVNYNLIPFKTILELIDLWTSGYLIGFSIVNFFGNIVMFVPLGFLLPCLLPSLRRFWKHTLCVAAIIVAVELIQLFTLLGVCDIDDLILNIIGGMIGFGLFHIVKIHRKTISKG